MKTLSTKFVTNSSTTSFSVILETDKLKEYIETININNIITKVYNDTHGYVISQIENKTYNTLSMFKEKIEHITTPFIILNTTGEFYEISVRINYTILNEIVKNTMSKSTFCPAEYSPYTYTIIFPKTIRTQLYQKLRQYKSKTPLTKTMKLYFADIDDPYIACNYINSWFPSKDKSNILKLELQMKGEIRNVEIDNKTIIDQMNSKSALITFRTFDPLELVKQDKFVNTYLYTFNIDTFFILFDDYSMFIPKNIPFHISQTNITTIIPCIEDIVSCFTLP